MTAPQERSGALRVCLAGGGTGGHFYPLMAIGEAVRRKLPDASLFFLGARVGVDRGLCEAEGVEHRLLSSRPLAYRSPLRWPPALLGLAWGIVQAHRALRRVRPHVLIGTGGYVCASAVPAARLLGVPVLLHDSDAHPGRTTRLLARWADAITVAYDSAAAALPPGKTRVTGQPIRRKVLEADREEAIGRLGLDRGRKTLLVTGGSRGARSLNSATLEALPRLAARDDLQILHLTGRGEHESVAAAVEAMEQSTRRNHHIRAYLNDMEQALAAADVVVCRAGSSSLAEAAVRGLPMIIVPYPHAAAHQEANAAPLAEGGAGVIIRDAELTGRKLAATVEGLLDEPGKLDEMSRAADRAARPDAADCVADIAVRLAPLDQ